MLAPTAVHRYACPCSRVVLEVAGPSWKSWDLAHEAAIEHAETCERAKAKWDVVVVDADTPPPRREGPSCPKEEWGAESG